jgi:hypothetical protein
MSQRRKDNHEPVCREKWLEFKFHDFEYTQDKSDVDRMASLLGEIFQAEFRKRKEELRQGGMSVKSSWQTTIGEFADRVPTREERKKDGTFKKYERNRRASNRTKDEHDVLVGNAMARMELHNFLAGKTGTVPDIEWVAANLFAGVDLLALDPEDIPSQTAANMLEGAKEEPAKFWAALYAHQDKKAADRTSLSDSGRTHVEVVGELFAERDVFDAMMETTDVAVGA